MKWINLPTYFGNPNRTLIYTKEQLKMFIKINNGKNPIFFLINSPPLIDKIFFDFDNGEITLNDAKMFENYLYNKNISHTILFSGRGFHIYVLTKPYIANNPKQTLINAYNYIISESKVENYDNACVGDIQRLGRMPNTINQKSGLYCTYISHEEIQSLNFEKIKEIGKEQRKQIINNNETLEISHFDSEIEFNNKITHINNSGKINIKKLDDTEFNNIFNLLPPCIKEFINDYKKDNTIKCYQKRMLIIKYLQDLGFDLETTVNFFYTFLSDNKFRHAMYAEKQFSYLYNSSHKAPSCKRLEINFNCINCELYPYPSKKIKEIININD